MKRSVIRVRIPCNHACYPGLHCVPSGLYLAGAALAANNNAKSANEFLIIETFRAIGVICANKHRARP
jgi:hypothetical protein